MDIKSKSQQPISDDQELAKVLAGVNQQADDAAGDAATSLPPLPPAPAPADESAVAQPEPAAYTQPDVPAAPLAPATEMPAYTAPAPAGDLDSIKQEALGELRPLVDKLNVSPEEKFDTYLLLIRSTDDRTLVGPAHEAAKSITDEARRAQALLDIIKEIDFLSQPQQAN